MMGSWFGGMFSGMWMLMMLGMAAVYIIFLLAAWRAMRAHESLAESVKEIVENMKPRP